MPARPYGWRRQLPDHRDMPLRLAAPVTLPPHVDLRPAMPPVYDQGELGSCTANAIAAAVQYERRRQNLPDFQPSRLAIYYAERALEHTTHTDSGAMIRDGMRVVNKTGVADEGLWPYDISKFARKPPTRYYAEAKKHLTTAYYAVQQDATAMRTALAASFPIVVGFTVYESFESDAVAASGVVPMPGRNESVLGGHAVLVVGYDDPSQRFIVRNSWGTGWGQAGYFTIPMSYLTNSNLASDFWVAQVEG